MTNGKNKNLTYIPLMGPKLSVLLPCKCLSVSLVTDAWCVNFLLKVDTIFFSLTLFSGAFDERLELKA